MRLPKNPKESHDEDRSRKKKIKSKSAQRRRDPSISSNSSSSESEHETRSRRKSSKSKKLEKRRKESKKSERRKIRKKRYRTDSSLSSFTSDSGGRRSCSTFSDSARSRSPVKKSKSRRRERERGRKSSRRRLELSPSRYRSRSCSTCSKRWGRSRSRSRSRTEGRCGSSRYRSRSCSSCSRSLSHSPIEERYGSSRLRSPLDKESPPTGERFGSSHGRSRYMEEGETKRLGSVLTVKKTSDEDEDKIIEAYDDYPQSYEGYDDEGNKKRNLDVGNKEKDSYGTRIREDVTSSKDRGQPVKDSDVGGGATNDYSMRKESEVVGEDGGKEADDLEMILRQKALENFRKFRGVRPANRESLSDKKDESSKLEPCQGSQSLMKTSESNPPTLLDDHRHDVQGGVHPNKLKARSVANIPTEKIDGNAVHNLSNDAGGFKPVVISIANQNTFNQFKRSQELSDKKSSEETSLTKDSQNKKIVALPDSGKVSQAEIDTADKPASVALNAENQNCTANEPMVESSSGSLFEKKTFSRVCDGETVQASYKVYIPKKTPALARRQLQR